MMPSVYLLYFPIKFYHIYVKFSKGLLTILGIIKPNLKAQPSVEPLRFLIRKLSTFLS